MGQMSDSAKNPFEDAVIDEIMAGFRQNSKDVLRDMLRGIGMYRFASTLTRAIGFFVIFYTVILVGVGYYRVGQLVGAVGAYGSIAMGVAVFAMGLWLRKEHGDLKRKYSALFKLAEKFGVS